MLSKRWFPNIGTALEDRATLATVVLDDLLAISSAREALSSGRAVEIREAANLTQAEVAAFCGVTSATVSRWESKSRQPRGAAAKRFSRLLDALAEGRR